MTHHCSNTKFVLKCDDDVAVDVYHLHVFLGQYIEDPLSHFYLCYINQNNKPQRQAAKKWFVSLKEYPHDSYPKYCVGGAYVTNIPTMKSMLQVSQYEPYFWIDDVFLTGILTEKLAHPLHMYNWANCFLIDHVDQETEILQGTLFSREIMVAFDIDPKSILHLSYKFKLCHEKRCYEDIYKDHEMISHLKPPVHVLPQTKIKVEL